MTLDSTDLVEIEAIKQLKARYCRLFDAKDWMAWRQIFTDDFVAVTRSNLEKPSQATAHQVHAPEIELTSPTTARGIWALEDVVRLAPGLDLRGYGHYHETYEKVGDRWLIRTSTLTRLREDIFNVFFSVYMSDRIRKATVGLGRRFTK